MKKKDIVRKALEELQSALGSLYGTDAPSVVLYGSQARGMHRNIPTSCSPDLSDQGDCWR